MAPRGIAIYEFKNLSHSVLVNSKVRSDLFGFSKPLATNRCKVGVETLRYCLASRDLKAAGWMPDSRFTAPSFFFFIRGLPGFQFPFATHRLKPKQKKTMQLPYCIAHGLSRAVPPYAIATVKAQSRRTDTGNNTTSLRLPV